MTSKALVKAKCGHLVQFTFTVRRKRDSKSLDSQSLNQFIHYV